MIPRTHSVSDCLMVNSTGSRPTLAVPYVTKRSLLMLSITEESRYEFQTPYLFQEAHCKATIITAHKIVNAADSVAISLADLTTSRNTGNVSAPDSFSGRYHSSRGSFMIASCCGHC